MSTTLMRLNTAWHIAMWLALLAVLALFGGGAARAGHVEETKFGDGKREYKYDDGLVKIEEKFDRKTGKYEYKYEDPYARYEEKFDGGKYEITYN